VLSLRTITVGKVIIEHNKNPPASSGGHADGNAYSVSES
jgi:hypothetical protein